MELTHVGAAEQRRRMNYTVIINTWLIADAGGGYDYSTLPDDGMLTVVAMATAREIETETTAKHPKTHKTEMSCFQLMYNFKLMY